MKKMIFIVICLALSGCAGKRLPPPDATKESQSLLVIPFSVDYPTNFGTPVKGWGIKFNSRMNKTISFDPKIGQDYLVVEMGPGDYIGSKFIHPDHEENDYIYGSYPRNRKDLDKSKRENLRHLSFKLVNKNIKIADFRFTYWHELGNDGRCCSYYGIIESIDNMVINRTLDKISKLENFEKWKFDGKVQPPVKVETYTYPDGGKYVGKFKDGKKNGQGTFTYPEGQKYVGRWKDDKRNGQGTLTSPSGYKYEGEWKDGKPDGQGTETFPDGSTYVGEWQNGLPNGQGTKTYPNGSKYVGEWKDAREHGQGTLTWSDGRKSVGEWKDGKMTGQGTETFPNGHKYEGEFKDGKPNGQGTYTYPDGRKYVGEWKDGRKYGQGTFTYLDGKMYVGEFKNGKWDGQGTFTFPNGNKGIGEFRENKPWNITEYDNYGNIIVKWVNGVRQ